MTLRKLAITAYAAIVLALFSSPAVAQEAHLYSSWKNWDVIVTVNDDGSMFCSAGTVNNRDETLDIVIRPTGSIQVRLWFDNRHMDVKDQEIVISINKGQSVQDWRISTMFMTQVGGYFFFEDRSKGLRFIQDLEQGRSIQFPRPFQVSNSGLFSLAGSKVAMDKLFECFRRTQGLGT